MTISTMTNAEGEMSAVIKQRYEWDCFLASIAMAVAGDYDKLWLGDVPHDSRFPTIYATNFVDCMIRNHGIFDANVDHAFNRAGLQKDVDYWTVHLHPQNIDCGKAMIKGRRAILQVPSLNNEGGRHIVYWDGSQVRDPSTKQQ
jgi:hypothetical protein